MRDLFQKTLGLSCFLVGVGLVAASCGGGGDNNGTDECGADQTFATVNGVEKCYDNCDNGACPTGFSCESNLCISDGANNGTNNGTTNNTTSTNNGTTNNTTGTNNGVTNNTTGMTNNNTNGMTNGGCQEIMPAVGECDALCQTGCMADQNCVVASSGPGAPAMAVCQPAGTAVAGDACDQMTACAEGHGCLTTDGGATFSCRQYCRVGDGEPSCAGAATCAAADPNIPELGICIEPEDECTGYPNDSCPDGQNCYQTNIGLRCVDYNAAAMPGDACASPTDCNDAQGCVGDGMTNNCRALCDPAAPMCAGTEQCVQLTNLPYGACIPM